MIVVDKKDMESLSERDVQKLLRWCCEEILRRDNDPYGIENEVTEALLNHYDGTATTFVRVEVDD
jgi:predicted N-formylglutamate amidohydrolase